jgi:hypothetical protein
MKVLVGIFREHLNKRPPVPLPSSVSDIILVNSLSSDYLFLASVLANPLRYLRVVSHKTNSHIMAARLMRLGLFSLSTLFLWAGTVSLHFGDPPRTTSPPTVSCFNKGAGETLLTFLQTGRIKAIRDNGRILTIGLSSQWSSLPLDAQYGTYEAVACYAKSQQRAFQLIEIP